MSVNGTCSLVDLVLSAETKGGGTGGICVERRDGEERSVHNPFLADLVHNNLN